MHPYGWLIDDSDNFRPWFLPATTEGAQDLADGYRSRGRRVVTLWAAPADIASALEAHRLNAKTYLEQAIAAESRAAAAELRCTRLQMELDTLALSVVQSAPISAPKDRDHFS